jgi:hypothetical protein
MERVFDDIIDGAVGMIAMGILVVASLGLFLIGYAIFAAVTFGISMAIAKMRYEHYLAQEQDQFDAIIADEGVGGKAEDVLHAVFGVDHFAETGPLTASEWVTGSLFGVETDKYQ